MSTPSNALAGAGLPANIIQRLQYFRNVGFQAFTINKPFVVSDAVPKGKVRAILALSAFRGPAAARTLHFFAIPPSSANGLANPVADSVASIFAGALNGPPVREGVLISVGGNTGVGEMASSANASVNGLLNPVLLPEGWKILCFDDSATGAIAADGITLDVTAIDFDFCECLPDALL
ncbi:MAG TPA: hypothetical protein VGR55_01305 [Candidatus Acidoferrum sp.]|nr:hypothetical protein [Candidatus Acidoferrum sp.]